MAERDAASGEDRISALPLDLRLRLLSMLTVEEAVMSSELSSEWRGLWKKMPSLRLVGLAERFDTAEEFNQFVNHLMVLRGHLPLEEFEIEVRKSDTPLLYPYANLWIQYALICKVRVLHVFCEPAADDCIQLSVPLVSERLTTLNLDDVDFEKCSALVDSKRSLDFKSCPLLKDLRMRDCGIWVHKISSKSLETLCIITSSFHRDFRTWICAPSLTSLELTAITGEAPVLENMPLLQRAFIFLDADDDCCDGSNSGAQKCADLSCECCYGYPLDSYQSVVLNGLSNAIHLRLIAHPKVTLLLGKWCLANGFHGLVCILRHSPILEKLTLLLSNTVGFFGVIGDDVNHGLIEQKFACAHLKAVEIKCQEMNEWVSKTLKLLSTCGIPPEHITLKVNQSHLHSFF